MLGASAVLLASFSTLAQQADPAPAPAESGAAPSAPGGAEAAPDTPTPNPTPGATTVYTPFGFPPPGADLNPNLPSSSKPTTDATSFSDGFDLAPNRGASTVVRGREGATAVLEDEAAPPVQRAPDIHTVRRGDTLWDLSERYYGSAWNWPRLWSFNPHVANPHWIYPGDQLRMRRPGAALGEGATSRLAPGASASRLGKGRGRDGSAPGDAILLGRQGFLADPRRDTWGELIGAREEQMLLSSGNLVYLQLRPGVSPERGQRLSVFTPARGRRADDRGALVNVRGTVQVERFDPKTRVAEARITESLDVIERGAKVGDLTRELELVAAKTSNQTVRARVLNAVYPHVYLAQHQVVLLDRGAKAGLEPGTRLVVVRQGDTWRKSLRYSDSPPDRVDLNAEEHVRVEPTPLHGDQEDFPEEIVAELRVLSVHAERALALVTRSRVEIVPGDVALARRGY